MNDQRSLKDQLTDLAAMADRAGMYDAADYVRHAAKLDGWAAGPDHERAEARLHAAAEEYAALTADGGPPLKPHEILAVFREAGCLYEREDSDLYDLIKRFISPEVQGDRAERERVFAIMFMAVAS